MSRIEVPRGAYDDLAGQMLFAFVGPDYTDVQQVITTPDDLEDDVCEDVFFERLESFLVSQGYTPKDDATPPKFTFRVVADESNNSPAEVKANMFNADIYIKPTSCQCGTACQSSTLAATEHTTPQ
jgi:hypothetical protein